MPQKKVYRLSSNELKYMLHLEKKFNKAALGFTRWPEIYYCNKKIEKPQEEQLFELNPPLDKIFDVDYLGAYISRKNEEGIIELYQNRIHECAQRISEALGLNLKQTVESLHFIVLMHELGHWFTHYCLPQDFHKKRAASFYKQSTAIVETMAQLTVVWALDPIKDEFAKRTKLIFDYMVPRQPSPYQQFLRLGTKMNRMNLIIKRYLAVLDKRTNDLDYLLN